MTTAATTRLTFTFTEDETVSCWRAVSARQMRVTQSAPFSWAAVFGVAPLIGLIVAAAYGLGMISSNELKPVLIASFAAFFAGVLAYGFAVHRSAARHFREMARLHGATPCELTCNNTGLQWKSANTVLSYDWKQITACEELAGFIVIWAGVTAVASVPRRAFQPPSEHAAFIELVRRRAKLG
jgi:hypothetical protein